MRQDDTVSLLKECNAGTKTAINSMEDVLGHVQNQKLRQTLIQSIATHQRLGDRAHEMLAQYNDSEEDPSVMARAMSWAKINMKLVMDDTDRTVANLMTDGCNMGIKSLCGYKNQYSQANQESVQLTDELIQEEEKLMEDLKAWL